MSSSSSCSSSDKVQRRRGENKEDLRHHHRKKKNPPPVTTNVPRRLKKGKNEDSSSSSESSISFSDRRRKMANKKIKPSDLARTDRELARRRKALLAEMNGEDDTTDEEEDAEVDSSPTNKSSPPKHLISPVSTTGTNSVAAVASAQGAPAARRTLVVQSSRKKTNCRQPSATFGKKKEVEVIDLLGSSSNDEDETDINMQIQKATKAQSLKRTPLARNSGISISDDDDNKKKRSASPGQAKIIPYLTPHEAVTSPKAVDQLDAQTGATIKRFPSIREAGRQTGIDQSSIGKAAKASCRDVEKTAGGFKWQYTEKLTSTGIGMKPINHVRAKTVQQLENSAGDVVIKTFSSAAEASRVIGVDASSICRAARGITKSAAGFRWRYVSNSPKTTNAKGKGKKRTVQQIDKDTNSLIREYDSTVEACRESGINNGSISQAASGLRPSAGGFKWRYKCDNGENDTHQNRDESAQAASEKSKRRLASSNDVMSKSPSSSSETDDSGSENDQAQDMDKKPAAKRRKQSHPTSEVIEIDDSDDDISDGRLGQNDSSAAPKEHTTTQKRWVQQLNVQTGSVLAIFESADMAAQSHGNTNISELQACLSGTRQECNGFGWRYVTCPHEMSLQEAFGRTTP